MTFEDLLKKTHRKIGSRWVKRDWPIGFHCESLLTRGSEVSKAEWEVPMNSYERHLLVSLLGDELLIEQIRHALQNCPARGKDELSENYTESVWMTWMPLLLERVERLQGVIKRHDLCHDLHGRVDARAFADGCAAEQRRLYGCAPDADRVKELEKQLEER